jgi:hypothetical protein
MVPSTLAEQLVLLALDDETGKLLSLPERAFDYALAGAILGDLTRAGRLKIDGDSIEIVSTDPVASRPEDFGLLEIKQSAVSSLRGALSHLAAEVNGLRHKVTDQLVEKGVLRKEDHEFLWVFHYSRYPLADQAAENAVKQRLRNRILMPEIPATESDHLLIALAHICELDGLFLSDQEQTQQAGRLREIARTDRIGSAVQACLDEIQKALMEIRTYSGL